MPEYSFTLWEHDAERPWVVVGQERHTAALEDGRSFFEWANERWPDPRFTVELDPAQLTQAWPPRSE
jgi:hypothetical protein